MINASDLKNGMKIITRYGDKLTVNYVIDNIVYVYESCRRVHVYSIVKIGYR